MRFAQLCKPDIHGGARRVLRGWTTSRHTMRIGGDGPATMLAMSWTFRHGLCQCVMRYLQVPTTESRSCCCSCNAAPPLCADVPHMKHNLKVACMS